MGEVGRAALGGQSGVTWAEAAYAEGRLAMRLWVGRICGLWSIPMVKLVSGGGAHWALGWVPVSAAVGDGVAGGGQRYGLPQTTTRYR